MNKKIGVYMILNTQTNECYIGSSMFLKRRIADHFRWLKSNSHFNENLQNSYNKYNKDAFEVKELELFEDISRKDLYEKEDHYIGLYKEKLFNIMDSSILSKYNKNRDVTQDLKHKISNGLKKFYKENPDAVKELSKRSKGKSPSIKTRMLISEKSKKNWLNPEFRKTVIEKNTGKKHSEETKAKMSAAHIGKKFSEESKVKMSLASKVRNLGRKHSEETKAKIREKALLRKRYSNGTFLGGKVSD